MTLCFVLSRKNVSFCRWKIKQPPHSFISYFISFVSMFVFLVEATSHSLSSASLINYVKSSLKEVRLPPSAATATALETSQFWNLRLIFSKQFLTRECFSGNSRKIWCSVSGQSGWDHISMEISFTSSLWQVYQSRMKNQFVVHIPIHHPTRTGLEF